MKKAERNTQIHRDYIAGKATIGQLAMQHNITRQRVWQIICYFDPSASAEARKNRWDYRKAQVNGLDADKAAALLGVSPQVARRFYSAQLGRKVFTKDSSQKINQQFENQVASKLEELGFDLRLSPSTDPVDIYATRNLQTLRIGVRGRTRKNRRQDGKVSTWQFNITNLKSDNLDFLILVLGQTGHFLVIPRDILVNKNILAYMLPEDKIIKRPNLLDTYLDAWHLLLSASKQ